MLSFKQFCESSEAFNDRKAWREHTQAEHPDQSIQTSKGHDYIVKKQPAMPGKMYYNVHHPKTNKQVGKFYVSGSGVNQVSVTNAEVQPKHKRKGIGTSVYDLVQQDAKKYNHDLVPQGKYNMTDDALGFWKKRDPIKYKKMMDDPY